jgi:hypothetical protein
MFQPFRIRHEFRGQGLDRDIPIKARVSGEVNLAHPACSERAGDAIGAKRLIRPERHFSSPQLRRHHESSCCFESLGLLSAGQTSHRHHAVTAPRSSLSEY